MRVYSRVSLNKCIIMKLKHEKYINVLLFLVHIWQRYCYQMIFAGAGVLMVHTGHLTLDLVVDACIVVRGLLHGLYLSSSL